MIRANVEFCEAAVILRNGGTVAFPTENFFRLGASALADSGPLLLRSGGTPVEEIEGVIGPVRGPGADPDRPTSPGRFARHYTSRTPLILCDDLRDRPPLPRSGLAIVDRLRSAAQQPSEAVGVDAT